MDNSAPNNNPNSESNNINPSANGINQTQNSNIFQAVTDTIVSQNTATNPNQTPITSATQISQNPLSDQAKINTSNAQQPAQNSDSVQPLQPTEVNSVSQTLNGQASINPSQDKLQDKTDEKKDVVPNYKLEDIQDNIITPIEASKEELEKIKIESTSLGTSKNGQPGESSDQIRRLGEKIEKAVLPEDLKRNLIERIQRLALLRASSGQMSANYIVEYENTSTYVNWATSLPWDKRSEDILDLVAARKILDKNHYGLPSVKNRILEYLAAIILNKKNNPDDKDYVLRAPILCLVGLVGTGKTTLAKSIAEALGRNFERIPFGGMADSRALRGQSRAFADAEPGYIIKKLVHAQTKNSVILLDELDRVSQEARGDIMGVLVELLDPEQNKAFTDHYVDYPFDLSQVLFISTANNTTNISTAVLDRLEIVQMPSYTHEEKIVIAKNYLFPKIREQVGIKENQISIDDAVWDNIVRPLGFDSGIRSLERTIEGVCRKVARLIVEGQGQSYAINSQNIKEFLPTW